MFYGRASTGQALSIWLEIDLKNLSGYSLELEWISFTRVGVVQICVSKVVNRLSLIVIQKTMNYRLEMKMSNLRFCRKVLIFRC